MPITVTIVVCSIVVLALTAFFIEAMLKGKESPGALAHAAHWDRAA